MERYLSRRGLMALAASVSSGLSKSLDSVKSTLSQRQAKTLELRNQAALLQSNRPLPLMRNNGDEAGFPSYAAMYTKGLVHSQAGIVDARAYQSLLTALKSGRSADFEAIPHGFGRKLSNPQAALTYHLEGGDPHSFNLPLAPSIGSKAAALETSELYWQALARDVPFSAFPSAPIIRQAALHLGQSPSTVFRGLNKADSEGPYISQFLYKSIPNGSGNLTQTYRSPKPGGDFLTTVSEWKQIQNGMQPWLEQSYHPEPRYIRTGRDLAEYVHYDHPYQAYLNAALILFNSGPATILNCNPFKSPNNPYRYSTIQDGFATFGQVEVFDWIGRVTTAAVKAAYYQKWMVHRKLRPEELGGLIQQVRTASADYALHPDLIHSPAVDAVFFRTGSYLLPQAYPEGAPLHPAYPAGHAAIAGACSVILKVCFDESMLLPGCVIPSVDGLSLEPCKDFSPTIGAEIDKLVSNVALARNWAGIHYRSDGMAGIELGEDVAISILQDLVRTYTEDIKGLTFTRFSGKKVFIATNGQVTSA